MADTRTVVCTHVTIHRDSTYRPHDTIHVDVERLGEQLARLDVTGDYVCWTVPETDQYCAVAWNGERPVLQVRSVMVGGYSDLRVGPFPLVFEVSTA